MRTRGSSQLGWAVAAVVNLATGHYDWFELDRPVIPANIYLSED